MATMDLYELLATVQSALPEHDLGYLRQVNVPTKELKDLLTLVTDELVRAEPYSEKQGQLCSARGVLLHLLWTRAAAA
jgi:hypothetical protein